MRIALTRKPRNAQSIDDRIMPLINIVFLLLIFFMVAGVLKEPEPFELAPPESSVEGEIEKPALMIFVARDGRIMVDEAPVLQGAFGAVIEPVLVEAPDRRIRIAADKHADAILVIGLMETLRSLGAERVHLTTRAKENA